LYLGCGFGVQRDYEQGMSEAVTAFSLFPGDSVVLIALLGITIGALAGRLAGGIRVAFFLLSLTLALGFGHLLAQLELFATITKLVGFENPLWQLLVPRLLSSLLLALIFVAILEPVHRKIYLHYKYKHKDGLDSGDFDTWEYLNDIWGLTLGLGGGVACLMLLFGWLHAPGYLLLQTRPTERLEKFEPWGHRLMRRICSDMHVLGLDAPATKFGPAQQSYYAAADTVGYIYHNYGRTNIYERNRFHQRVFGYPGIRPLLQQKEIDTLWTKSTFLTLGDDNATLSSLTHHADLTPLLQAACLPYDDNRTTSLEFTKHLANLDLIDYQKFLREGQSDVFSANNLNKAVLGSWQLAVDHTYDKLRLHYPRAREAQHLSVLKFLRETAFLQYTLPDKVPMRQYDWILTFTADNKVFSNGRYFPTGSLFTKNQQGYHFSNPNIHPNRKQWANGTWSAASSNASEFLANLRVNTNPVITMKVRITSANNHLMIKFPTKNFNGEEYVFRRYEF